jgi:hypothetical protein
MPFTSTRSAGTHAAVSLSRHPCVRLLTSVGWHCQGPSAKLCFLCPTTAPRLKVLRHSFLDGFSRRWVASGASTNGRCPPACMAAVLMLVSVLVYTAKQAYTTLIYHVCQVQVE